MVAALDWVVLDDAADEDSSAELAELLLAVADALVFLAELELAAVLLLVSSVVSLLLLLSVESLLELELWSSLEESLLDLSEALSLELSSGLFLSLLLEDDVTTRLVAVLLAAAPFTVWVVLLTTTLVAPSANTIETIANGEINGGVRYAINVIPFSACRLLSQIIIKPC